MSSFILENVPVHFGQERLSGKLSIRQNDCGRLHLFIESGERNYRGDAAIESTPGIRPLVRVDPALYNGSYSNGHDVLIKVFALEVHIDHEQHHAPDTPVTFKCCLVGERTSGFEGAYQVNLDGRAWLIEVVRGSDWYEKAIRNGSDFVPLEATIITQQLVFAEIDAAIASLRKALVCLSFALGGHVGLARYEVHRKDGKSVKKVLVDVSGPERMWMAPIPVHHLGKFIEWTYPRLAVLEQKVKIQSLMKLLTWARNQHVNESQALNLVGVLEMLRFQYATNYLVPEGKAKATGDRFAKIKSGVPVTRKNSQGKEIEVNWSFAEIHREMAKGFGLSRWDGKKFTNCR